MGHRHAPPDGGQLVRPVGWRGQVEPARGGVGNHCMHANGGVGSQSIMFVGRSAAASVLLALPGCCRTGLVFLCLLFESVSGPTSMQRWTALPWTSMELLPCPNMLW